MSKPREKTCKICNTNGIFYLIKHLRVYHPNITPEEYNWRYILGLESPPKCKRPECNNTARFINLTSGYGTFCSVSCSIKYAFKFSDKMYSPFKYIRDSSGVEIADHPNNIKLHMMRHLNSVKANRTRLLNHSHNWLDPTTQVHNYKHCIFTVGNVSYHLRSSYEFLFALYLCSKGLSWSSETAILVDSSNKLWMNDFVVGRTIFEVKPKYLLSSIYESLQPVTAKLYGYRFVVITESLLFDKCSNYIRSSGIDLDSLYHSLLDNTMNNFNYDSYRSNLLS